MTLLSSFAERESIMVPFLRFRTSLAVVLTGFVFWGGVFIPFAKAMPGAGIAKDISIAPMIDRSVQVDQNSSKGLVKKVGLRLHITYGGYGYPGGSYRYGRHRQYSPYGYRRTSYGAPSYRYRSYRRYRAYPRYKVRRHRSRRYRVRRHRVRRYRRHSRRYRSRRHRIRHIRRLMRRLRY